MAEVLDAIEYWISVIGVLIDAFGVIVIVIGLFWSIYLLVKRRHSHPHKDQYQPFMTRIGRFLILGLEILVAADIIKTVALTPTFTSVGVLALIVVVRTFLSWSLVPEIEGRWPWQPKKPENVVDLS